MKTPCLFLASLAAVFALSTHAHANLLLNGDFETPVSGTVMGSNYPITIPNWIVSGTAGGAANAPLTNLVVGTATGTQASGSTTTTTLPSYQFDGSTTHNQSLDGVNATVYASQSFNLATASALSVSAAIGGRDSGSGSTAASNLSNWTITGTDAANSGVSASGTGTAPTFGQWAVDAGITSVLPAGNYRFTVTLANPDQLDAAVVTAVPEPSAWITLGGSLIVFGLRLCRRRRS